MSLSPDTQEYICPQCGAAYDITREVVEYEDEFTSSHEDENPEIAGIGAGTSSLLSAEEDEDPELTNLLYKDAKHKPIKDYTESWD